MDNNNNSSNLIVASMHLEDAVVGTAVADAAADLRTQDALHPPSPLPAEISDDVIETDHGSGRDKNNNSNNNRGKATTIYGTTTTISSL